MAQFSWSLGILVALISTVVVAAGRAKVIHQVTDGKLESHRISQLPGAPEVAFSQYSGYITVDETTGKALFYWLIEADVPDPKSLPLTLWLNGGPGCSSVGGGTLSELGPFFPAKDGKTLIDNPHSWNKVSNMLFLESPAGVGFSYSNTSSDYVTGDAKTASDSVEFLIKFMELYPAYAKSPFYITGESYAGHYVPQLAVALLEKNKELGDSAIDFKGIAVGNAWTDTTLDNVGAIFYWWSHALISDKTYFGMLDSCNFSRIGPMLSAQQSDCHEYVQQADQQMENIWIYEVYADICISPHLQAETRHFAKQLNRNSALGSIGARPLLSTDDYDPCVDDEVEAYLNQPDVQKALHVDVPGIKYRWTDCSYVVDYSYEDLMTSVLPLYDTLIKSGLEILIFSGDLDGIVPVTGTRAWINALNLDIKADWRQYLVNKQVGGFVTEYDGLTLATVRGAGHMVAYTQAERALHLFQSFITKTPL